MGPSYDFEKEASDEFEKEARHTNMGDCQKKAKAKVWGPIVPERRSKRFMDDGKSSRQQEKA